MKKIIIKDEERTIGKWNIEKIDEIESIVKKLKIKYDE